MSNSPLQFAKQFAQLKSTLATAPPDGKLMAIAGFWPNLESHRADSAYRSYFDELTPLFLELITESALTDVTIDELRKLRGLIGRLEDSPAVQKAARLLDRQVVRLLLYAGDIESALSVCNQPGETGKESQGALAIPDGLNEFEALTAVCEACSGADDAVYRILEPLRVEWEALRESLSNDTACCLFVERSNAADSLRGRMRQLEGTVDLFGKNVTQDEVSFHNQVVGPRDPFIGAAYKALEAVKSYLSRQGWKKRGLAAHAHFEIVNSDHTFTGDSIGLAFAAVAYAQLLKPELLRMERFVSAEAAFTGGLDTDGNLTPVNDETLPLKIARAFFSPVRYVVLPEQNLRSAASIVNDLRRHYPRRHLKLIGAERLEDVLEDRNVIRAEKVCLGEYVVKKAYKYSRATKVQVPLLVAVVVCLLAILFPKWTPWFDWRIATVKVVGDGMRLVTLNVKGQKLDIAPVFEEAIVSEAYSSDGTHAWCFYYPVDNDGDNRDELFLAPRPVVKTSMRAILQLYDDNGRLQASTQSFRLTSYPGDKAYPGIAQQTDYSIGMITPMIDSCDTLITVSSSVSNPARCQILSFDMQGELISGPYLHTGHPNSGKSADEKPCIALDIDGDGCNEYTFVGTNNRLSRACLLILDPRNLTGVSPPYDNELFRTSEMEQGSHLAYIAFPETFLSSSDTVRNFAKSIYLDSIADKWHVVVQEGIGLTKYSGSGARPPTVTYVFDRELQPVDLLLFERSIPMFIEQEGLHRGLKLDGLSELKQLLLSEVLIFRPDRDPQSPTR